MNRKLTFEPLGSRLMLSGADYLGWQLNLGSTAEFPEYDMNYDGTVNAADLAPALDAQKPWLGEPPAPDSPPTAPQGLMRVTDKMEFLFDDSMVLAAMQNYTGKQVVHVPREHALWIEVLDVNIAVEGTIRFYERSSGAISVQADLTDVNNNSEIRLHSYRRNILIADEMHNVSGRTSFSKPTDVYNANIIDDGWMLQRQHHTEHANGIDADWTEWYSVGQEYHKTGYVTSTANNITIDGDTITETVSVQRDEWTGPIKPTTKELDTTITTSREFNPGTKILAGSEVIDKDTITAYDEEQHEGLWLNLARDQDVVTNTTIQEYEVWITSSELICTTNEWETQVWNYSVLEDTTSLTIEDRTRFPYEEESPAYSILSSYNGDDFSRGFVYYQDHTLESFDAEYNDERLTFIPIYNYNNVIQYRITVDTFGITNATELAERVRYFKEREGAVLPEGVTSEPYPEIDTSVQIIFG